MASATAATRRLTVDDLAVAWATSLARAASRVARIPECLATVVREAYSGGDRRSWAGWRPNSCSISLATASTPLPA